MTTSSTALDAPSLLLLEPGAHAPARGQLLLRRAVLLFLVWSVPGLVSATQLYFVYQLKEPDFTFERALLWSYPPWLVWAAATPVILVLTRRFPVDVGLWRRNLPVHLATMGLFNAGCSTVAVLCGRLACPPCYERDPLGRALALGNLKQLHLALLLYVGVYAVGCALEFHRRYREGTVVQAQLQTRLAHAQLDALKMQLHPHFLFNTLNAIAALVRKQEGAAAVRMIAGVSDLLRLALYNTGKQTVPLRQELDFVERYLALEQMRFADRLQVVRRVDPGALSASVPNLLLQPLVENALKHGISARAAAGRLELAAVRQGDVLHLEVRDDGPGPSGDWEEGGGIGLANVRARLQQLYGDRHVLRLQAHPGGGACVVVELPYTLEEEDT